MPHVVENNACKLEIPSFIYESALYKLPKLPYYTNRPEKEIPDVGR